jgi:DNA-directed RNA polymerase subunit RPC12/RpoP
MGIIKNLEAIAPKVTGLYFVEPLPLERFKKDVQITESEPICPHCKKILNKRPKRKLKCPSCSNDIYVRSKPRVFNTTLLTKDDSIAVDWYNKLEWQGIEQRDFLQTQEEMSKTNKDIKSTEVIFQLLKRELINSRDIYWQRVNNFELALFLYETSGAFFEYLSDSSKCRLMELKQSGFEKARIASVGGCDACINLAGKVLTINEALEKMPIPVKECSNRIRDGRQGWCRCMYVAV